MSLTHTIKYDIAAFTAPSVTIATTVPGVNAVAEVQTITVDAGGGTFTTTWSGQTTTALAYNISAADFTTALEALSNIVPGDVVVTGGPGDAGGTTPYTLTWLDTLGNVAQPTTDPALLTGGAGTAAVATGTPGSIATAETQTIAVVGSGGTFTITFSGQTTSALAYNATAAQVQAALWALSNIADNDVVVTLVGSTYTLAWIATLGNVAAPTATITSLVQTGARVMSDAFRNVIIDVVPDTTPNYTILFVKSDSEAEPDFSAASTSTNQWSYCNVVNLDSGATITGSTGATPTTPQSYEFNVNSATWLGVLVTTYVTGNLTGTWKLANNQ